MKKIFITLWLIFSTGILSFAQGQLYYTTTLNDNYSPLLGGTPFLADDAHKYYDTMSLGFNISLAGVTGNRLYVTAWGGISLVGSVYSDPHIETFGAPHSKGSYTYKIDGETGARIIKLQFKDVRFDHDMSMEDYANYQVWIFEMDNTVMIHFGNSSVNNAEWSYYFNQGGAAIGMNKLWLKGDPGNPSADTSSQSRLNGTPPDGQKYFFALRSVGVNEVNKLDDAISLFPNPASDKVYLQAQVYPVEVYVTDITGKLLHQQQIANKTEPVDVSKLSTGMYLLRTNDKTIKFSIAE